MKSAPFSRIAAFMALAQAALASGIQFTDTYVSRGHGIGKHSGKKWSSYSGKYTQVFNGKRECERRVRQMAISRTALP